jgi:hypothetical protein
MTERPRRRRARVLAVAALSMAAAGRPRAAHAQAPCNFWVAPPPVGSDANPGTQALPWATLNFASAQVLALGASGSTVCFMNGVYTGGNSLYERFTAPTTFRAENTYRAVLQNSGTAVSLFGARNMVFEGFELRHSGPGAGALVIQVQQDGVNWAEDVAFRNNILHDSWNNDILKINNGARFVTVEGNVFYNQTGSDEHIDINGVTDVVVQDNIFFNDFAGSGRPNNNDTSSYIVIKDSGALIGGSARITVRRNVFLNWEGSGGSNFLLLGEDAQPFHEAHEILVENNLMIGNSANLMRAAFGVKGGRNVTFRNNTVAGNLPTLAYAFRINREGSNPVNQDVVFHNNVWSDPAGTMGAEGGGGNDFSDGAPSEVTGLILDRNLYWNGGSAIPPGDQVNPNVDDLRRIIANPLVNTNQAGIVLPHWNGTAFPGGNTTIRDEFVRLVNLYGAIPAGSPGHNQADAALAPADDILGNLRVLPDMGAFEVTAPPALSVSNIGVAEGDGGTVTASFNVTLSLPAAQTVTVQYATADVTAVAGLDYIAGNGTVTFPPGTTSQPISVPIIGDLLDEDDETFTVNLSNPTNATIADGAGLGTITDDDEPAAAGPAPQGYSLVGEDGSLYAFGTAKNLGDMRGKQLNAPIIGVAYTPGGNGYWLVAKDGGIFTFGDADFFGSMGDKKLNSPIIGMAATPTGKGYWLFAGDGGIFTFGDADFFGSMGDKKLNAPVINMEPLASGRGYWLVAADGGIFTFGLGDFFGSMGDKKLNQPVFDMTSTDSDKGYWLVARDGGIFSFGDAEAKFFGSAVNETPRPTKVIGMDSTPGSQGYWIADASGKVYRYGDAQNLGDRFGQANPAPMVAFATVPSLKP